MCHEKKMEYDTKVSFLFQRGSYQLEVPQRKADAVLERSDQKALEVVLFFALGG